MYDAVGIQVMERPGLHFNSQNRKSLYGLKQVCQKHLKPNDREIRLQLYFWDEITNCLAITGTCSSGRHLSSSIISNSSLYKQKKCYEQLIRQAPSAMFFHMNSCLHKNTIYKQRKYRVEKTYNYLCKFCDHTKFLWSFKRVEHFNNILMLQLPQNLQ